MFVCFANQRHVFFTLIFLIGGVDCSYAVPPFIASIGNKVTVYPVRPEVGKPPNSEEWVYEKTQWKLDKCTVIEYRKEKKAAAELTIPWHDVTKIQPIRGVWNEAESVWSCEMKSRTYGYYDIEFKGQYRFVYKSAIPGDTRKKQGKPVDISVKATAVFYEAGFIDKIPNYSLDTEHDCVNFFLRQHSIIGRADYKDLKIYYSILPSDISDNIEKVNFTVYQEENTTKAIKEIDGEKRYDGKYAAGNGYFGSGLVAKWDDVREEKTDVAEPTKKYLAFRNCGFYQVQMNVKMQGNNTVFQTPLGDANQFIPGFQCKYDSLAIHDLVYKHRPVVHMGSGETVATNGPVYPFSEGIRKNYSLKKQGAAAWTALPNYFTKGSFPAFLKQDWLDFEKKYPVLEASRDNGGVGADQHYIDIEDDLTCKEGDPILFHRGHISVGQPPKFCFIQYWMYETASHPPYGAGNGSPFHEGDWEMVQLCIRVSGETKQEWFRPHAATASQHYYGQTLAWRIDKNGPEKLNQEYVGTEEEGNRIRIYIAENSHATYFRSGSIATWAEICGTQIQYEKVDGTIANRWLVDKITNPVEKAYRLVPLNYKDKQGIADWQGRWGGSVPGKFTEPAPQGPFSRSAHADTDSGHLNLNNYPKEFHNQCRKGIDKGKPQPEVELK